jgi:hypothetical protein
MSCPPCLFGMYLCIMWHVGLIENDSHNKYNFFPLVLDFIAPPVQSDFADSIFIRFIRK